MSTESEKIKDSEPKQCIACRKDIPAQSSLCSHCGSYQKSWKNQLRYFSTIVGLATFIITALVYLASGTPQLWKLLTWRDRVRVLDLSLPGVIVLANIGDGDIVVREFYWSGAVEERYANGSIQINKKISAQQVVETAELGMENKELHKGRPRHYIMSDEVPKESRSQLFKEARSDTNDCYEFNISLTKGHAVSAAEAANKTEFWSIPLQGTLYFYSVHSNKILEEKFPVLGFVMKLTDDKCPG